MDRLVTIGGHALQITFNMNVQILFEKKTKLAFSLDAINNQTGTMELCYAALKEANDSVPFTFEEMCKRMSSQETIALKSALWAAMAEWFEVPELAEDSKAEQTTEDSPKN